MKIEIDLNDILGGGEYGEPAETLQDSIRRQVIDAIVKSTSDGIKRKINEETSRVINEALQAAVQEQMPALLADLMNAEYVPVDRYGSRAAPTTFRNEMIKAIQEQMVYKKTSFSSDASAFTKAVDSVISENVNAFKVEFGKQVNSQFVAQAMQYAASEMSKRLGITK